MSQEEKGAKRGKERSILASIWLTAA